MNDKINTPTHSCRWYKFVINNISPKYKNRERERDKDYPIKKIFKKKNPKKWDMIGC